MKKYLLLIVLFLTIIPLAKTAIVPPITKAHTVKKNNPILIKKEKEKKFKHYSKSQQPEKIKKIPSSKITQYTLASVFLLVSILLFAIAVASSSIPYIGVLIAVLFGLLAIIAIIVAIIFFVLALTNKQIATPTNKEQRDEAIKKDNINKNDF